MDFRHQQQHQQSYQNQQQHFSNNSSVVSLNQQHNKQNQLSFRNLSHLLISNNGNNQSNSDLLVRMGSNKEGITKSPNSKSKCAVGLMKTNASFSCSAVSASANAVSSRTPKIPPLKIDKSISNNVSDSCCLNHQTKFAQYVQAQTQQHYCGVCAVELASLGYQVFKLGVEDGITVTEQQSSFYQQHQQVFHSTSLLQHQPYNQYDQREQLSTCSLLQNGHKNHFDYQRNQHLTPIQSSSIFSSSSNARRFKRKQQDSRVKLNPNLRPASKNVSMSAKCLSSQSASALASKSAYLKKQQSRSPQSDINQFVLYNQQQPQQQQGYQQQQQESRARQYSSNPNNSFGQLKKQGYPKQSQAQAQPQTQMSFSGSGSKKEKNNGSASGSISGSRLCVPFATPTQKVTNQQKLQNYQKSDSHFLQELYKQSNATIDKQMKKYLQQMQQIQEIFDDVKIKDIQYFNTLKAKERAKCDDGQLQQLQQQSKSKSNGQNSPCYGKGDLLEGQFDLFGRSLADVASGNGNGRSKGSSRVQQAYNQQQLGDYNTQSISSGSRSSFSSSQEGVGSKYPKETDSQEFLMVKAAFPSQEGNAKLCHILKIFESLKRSPPIEVESTNARRLNNDRNGGQDYRGYDNNHHHTYSHKRSPSPSSVKGLKKNLPKISSNSPALIQSINIADEQSEPIDGESVRKYNNPNTLQNQYRNDQKKSNFMKKSLNGQHLQQTQPQQQQLQQISRMQTLQDSLFAPQEQNIYQNDNLLSNGQQQQQSGSRISFKSATAGRKSQANRIIKTKNMAKNGKLEDSQSPSGSGSRGSTQGIQQSGRLNKRLKTVPNLSNLRNNQPKENLKRQKQPSTPNGGINMENSPNSSSCQDTPQSLKSKISCHRGALIIPSKDIAVAMFDKINICESVDIMPAESNSCSTDYTNKKDESNTQQQQKRQSFKSGGQIDTTQQQQRTTNENKEKAGSSAKQSYSSVQEQQKKSRKSFNRYRKVTSSNQQDEAGQNVN